MRVHDDQVSVEKGRLYLWTRQLVHGFLQTVWVWVVRQLQENPSTSMTLGGQGTLWSNNCRDIVQLVWAWVVRPLQGFPATGLSLGGQATLGSSHCRVFPATRLSLVGQATLRSSHCMVFPATRLSLVGQGALESSHCRDFLQLGPSSFSSSPSETKYTI